MLNEQRMLAPDRAQNKLGSDNDYEYRLTGYFSGETVYEPASNGFYPEFIFLGAEVKSTNPPNIYQQGASRNMQTCVSFSLHPSICHVRQVLESIDDADCVSIRRLSKTYGEERQKCAPWTMSVWTSNSESFSP